MRRINSLAAFLGAAIAVSACVSGCNSSGNVNAASPSAVLSPLAGNWTGKSDVKGGDLDKLANSLKGGPLTGSSSLTLNRDGTGFLKVADLPERPISWKQEGDRVILESRHVSSSETPANAEGTGGGPWVGRLSEDRRTMVIDMEQVKVTLSQQGSR